MIFMNEINMSIKVCIDILNCDVFPFVPLVFCLSLKLKSLLFIATKSGISEALHFKFEPCTLNVLESESGHTFFDHIYGSRGFPPSSLPPTTCTPGSIKIEFFVSFLKLFQTF